jgi:uncharacterized membrane protein YqjE
MISVQFIMPAILIMLIAVLIFSISMVVTLLFTPHWPTVAWTVFLTLGYVLQVTALWKASKEQRDAKTGHDKEEEVE